MLKELDIIQDGCEYYDDVYASWYPVPAFWIGDHAGTHTHKIRRRE
jgi:hypothetical protein